MSALKKSLTVFLVLLGFLASFALGMTTYKLNLTPIPELRFLKHFFLSPGKVEGLLESELEVSLVNYTQGVPVFSDRAYYDTLGPPALDGLTLIQIPRHYKDKIRINAREPLTVYRMVTVSNDNWLLEEYERTNLEVNVEGLSCTHTGVVRKTFPPGEIDLYPGGPTSASPILIDLDNTDTHPLLVIVKQE